MKKLTLILGNQLFDLDHFNSLPQERFFMAEDTELCTHFKYHKHKILFFLLAMREFKDQLSAPLEYYELDQEPELPYIDKLERSLKKHAIEQLHCFEVEDKFFEERLILLTQKLKIDLVVHSSPMFMVTRESFKNYLDNTKKPFMKTFYEAQRKHFAILTDAQGKPVGGQWSFDQENRKKWDDSLSPTPLPTSSAKKSKYFEKVATLINERFADHPGNTQHFWLPVTREESKEWLKDFVQKRLVYFGDYQDALTLKHDFLFHSVLSPMINAGLLTPKEVIDEVLKTKAPINSIEGFVRQVLGWREFVRGIYQEYDEIQQTENFWNHQRGLSSLWYEGETGVPPLDSALQRSWRFGYAHHIERLMVLSNIMLLCEIHPQEVYRWFMEMYVDSSDWVMGPNVFGMGQFSDGGIFATKPYICGSNYLLKMGKFPKGKWTDAIDGLYWQFIDKNRDFFLKNPRMSLAVRSVEKMDAAKKKKIYQAADLFREKMTTKAP